MDQNPPPAERVSLAAWWAMGVIVGALLFVAIYANFQRAHRDRVESVTIIRSSPTPAASTTVSPPK
jgi:hypothetical protein